ncbi:MAG: hypothetical protein ABJN75_02710, partial [Hoeflea sp.]|uniref:hypothetical protein n=1 Tax=Hoeflea sp. TaxID=1940281 RepID=UPI00329A118E
KKDNRFANRITLHHHIIHRRPPSKSEDHDRFSLLPLCHAFLHPIALAQRCSVVDASTSWGAMCLP